MTLTDNTKQHEQLHRKILEMQMKQRQAAPHTPNWTTLGMNTSNTSATFTAEPPPIKLDEGAWDIPVSQLVDLWTVRYGSKWVDESDLDEFYTVASRRLRALNKVESHFVNGKDVFRIVE